MPSASRSALMKLTLLLPSVARSSTSSTRWPGINCPSICAPRPKPFGFLRTYCIGRLSRSATQAANGMPAVSPPATASILSRPISRAMVWTAKSISVERTSGKRDQPARVVIDRARPAAGEDERLVGHEADGAGVEIHARRQLGDGLFVEEMGVHGLTDNPARGRNQGPSAVIRSCPAWRASTASMASNVPDVGSAASRQPGNDSYAAFGPAFMYQSAICAPVQNSTSFFFLIFSKILRKYLTRCGAPMM